MENFVLGAIPALAIPPQVRQYDRLAHVFREMLRRLAGHEPPSVQLKVQKLKTLTGSEVATVVCHFDPSDERAVRYAGRCWILRVAPWDPQARAQLGFPVCEKQSA